VGWSSKELVAIFAYLVDGEAVRIKVSKVYRVWAGGKES
jgi:hypothetical protein